MTDPSSPPIGLIAGSGTLPQYFVQEAKNQGHRILVVALAEEAPAGLDSVADKVVRLSIGQVGKIIKTLKDFGVQEVTWVGKIHKNLLFKNLRFDAQALKFLGTLREKDDLAMIRRAVKIFEEEGFKVFEPTRFLKNQMVPPGLAGGVAAAEKVEQDLHFAFEVAKKVAALNIGQTVMVKEGVILAVEAQEGTDEVIRRGTALGGKGTVMAKVSWPQRRFVLEIPTVGRKTLELLAEGKAAGLAIEAHKTLLLEREEVLKIARAAKIAVMALE